MSRSRAGFELRPSPFWSITALGISGALILLASDTLSSPLMRMRAVSLGVGLYVLMFATWRIMVSYPLTGTWLVISAATCAAILARQWLELPGALVLLALPTGIAAAFIGLKASTITAAIQTLLLMALPAVFPVANAAPITAPIFASWAMVGLMVTIYYPVYRILEWSWKNYLAAEAHVAEARGHRANLEGTLAGLTRANRQLALDNRRTAALRTQADEAQRSKTAFVSRVSHEFRAPLNMIIGLVGLMVERPEIYAEELPPDLRTDLEVIYRNSTHLSEMINDVLDLSQTEGGALTLHREPVNLWDVVQETAQAVSPLIDKKGVALIQDASRDLSLVECDRTRIRQVLLNLVSNAARYTEAGSITLRITEHDYEIVTEVSDTGPGVQEEVLVHIFEPFYRAAATAQKIPGSGLGLSISREIVQQHGGRIWVNSRPGEGASFFFSLPKRAPRPPVARPGHKINRDWVWHEEGFRISPHTEASKLVRPRIVVHDPEDVLRHEFQRSAGDVEVVTSQALAETLSELAACPTHAVIVNTGANGVAVTHDIERLRSQAPGTPVIACSIPNPMTRVLAAGANGYLIKPVSRESLVGAILQLPKVANSVLVVDDDPESTDLTDRVLRLEYPGLEVRAAASGQAALEADYRRRGFAGVCGRVEQQHRPVDLHQHGGPLPYRAGLAVLPQQFSGDAYVAL